MAGRVVVRRLAPHLPRWDCRKANTGSIPARAFASATSQAQESAVTNVGSKDKPSAMATQSSRNLPRSIFPSLFSPLYQSPSLTQMMDAVDSFFDSAFAGVPSVMRGATPRTPWDVIEDEKSFKLRMDMPGFSKDEVKLRVEDDDLVLKAEHNAEKKDDDWSSRSYGSLNMRIKLPRNVEFSGIKAEMKDGVLKVIAPKVEGAKETKEVTIEA